MTRRGLLLFVAMCVIWGVPYLLIKVAVRAVEPSVLVFLRTGIGAAALVPITAGRGELAQLRPKWKVLAVYTIVELAVPWFCLSTAEKRLPSSLSGLLVAAVPLVGAALAGFFGQRERLGWTGIAGLVIGLVGVGVLVGFDVHGADAASVALIGLVVLGYSLGPLLVVRDLQDLPPLAVVAVSLAGCALLYAPFAALQMPASMPPGRVVAAVVVLGLVCTATAFVLFFHLIGEIGPVRATVVTYVNPAVAVVLGVAFLDEHLGAATGAGFVLILTGSVLATRRPPRTPRAQAEAAMVAEP